MADNRRKTVRRIVLLTIAAVVCVLFLASALQATSPSAEREITVVFRYDDYSTRSATDFELKLIDAFQKRSLSCTFGVIPCVHSGDGHDPAPQELIPLSSAKAAILRRAVAAGTVEVALHGYSHQTWRAKSEGGYTEFSGLDYDAQLRKLTEGKRLLEELLGIRVVTFIPPWNQYDLKTIQGLECLKMECISSGLHGSTSMASSLKYVPATCSLRDVRSAVEVARKVADSGIIICVLFHSYDFREVNEKKGSFEMPRFAELLDWIASQSDVRVRSIAQTITSRDDIGPERFINNVRYSDSPFFRLAPPLLLPAYGTVNKVYLSSHAARPARIRVMAYIIALYMAAFVASIVVGFVVYRFFLRNAKSMPAALVYGVPACVIIILAYSLRDGKVAYRCATLCTVIVGGYAGAWVSSRRCKKEVGVAQAEGSEEFRRNQ